MCSLGEYKVVRDVPYTSLRAGNISNAVYSEWFSAKVVTLGWTPLDQRYFDFMLSLGYIDRILPE